MATSIFVKVPVGLLLVVVVVSVSTVFTVTLGVPLGIPIGRLVTVTLGPGVP